MYCRADGIYFSSFGRDGKYDAVDVAFSPDGLILYIATSEAIFAFESDGESTATWSEDVDISGLSDITVSPDGLSVNIVFTLAWPITHR